MSEYNNNNFDVNQTQVAFGTEVAKKKKPIALFAVGGVLLLAIAAVLSYLLIPSFKNTIKMTVMKPQKYYASVENDNISRQAKEISEQYGKVIEAYNNEKGTSMDYELSADINPDFLDDISTLVDYDIPAQFAKIKLNGSTAMKDDKISSDMMLSVNDVKIITLKMLMDSVAEEAYFQVPELTESFFKIPMSEFSDDILDEMDSTGLMGMAYTPTMESYDDTLISDNFEKIFNGELLSEKELEELINKYYNIAIENIEDVELEKGEEVEVGGVDAKFNTLTAKITEKDAVKIAQAILKEMKKDDVIIDAMVELEVCTEDEYKAFIEEGITELKDSTGDKNNFIKLITYVDSKGIICGRELEVYEDKEKIDDFELYYIAAKDGKDIAFEMVLGVEGATFSIELDGEEEAKETYSGDIKVEAVIGNSWDEESQPYSFNIKFEDYNVANEEKGYINGKFTLDLVVTKFTVDFKSDGDKQEVSVEIPDYATIKLTYSESKPEDITMPSDSEDIYDLTNDEDLTRLMEEIDFEAFIATLGENLGIDLEDLSSSLFGYGYGDYGDYDDYDDQYDSEKDDDYDDEYANIDYDLSKVDIAINGEKVVLAEGLANISNLVDTEGLTVIKAGESEYLYSEDYSISISLINETEADLPIEKCIVEYLHYSPYSNEPTMEFSINGIKVGSTVKEVATAFNSEISESASIISIYDADDYFKSVKFSVEDGRVASMTFSEY